MTMNNIKRRNENSWNSNARFNVAHASFILPNPQMVHRPKVIRIGKNSKLLEELILNKIHSLQGFYKRTEKFIHLGHKSNNLSCNKPSCNKLEITNPKGRCKVDEPDNSGKCPQT